MSDRHLEAHTPAGKARTDVAGESPAAVPVHPDARESQPAEAEERKKGKKGKKKEDRLGTSRGIETMFRTSYQTHNALSALADNKANIMISINGIIISILIASIAPRLGESSWLLLPTVVLLVGCVISMVYAVLAARPRVSRHPLSVEDARSGRANILFFGNFVRIPESDFVQGMEELMRNTDRVYLNMSRDIYALGHVLERKFRLLRVSYTVFMIGLVAGVGLLLATYVVTGFTDGF